MQYKNYTLALVGLFVITCFSGAYAADEPKKEQDKPAEQKWIKMFDGENLDNWSVPEIGGSGPVEIEDGMIFIGMGAGASGIQYEKEFPKKDYEIRYEAKKKNGYDFFGAITFPYLDSHCTFVNGGWGGGTIGLSSIDSRDASENQTTNYFHFDKTSWYEFRVRVAEGRITVWIKEFKSKEKIAKEEQDKADGKTARPERDPNEPVVDFFCEDHKISLRFESNYFKPIGIATWMTEGLIRKIEYRMLTPEEIEKVKKEVEAEMKR